MKARNLAAAFAATVMLSLAGRSAAQGPDLVHHVHGLAFSADGRELIVPIHSGLAVYADGKWSKSAGPAHDYMGFATTRSTSTASSSGTARRTVAGRCSRASIWTESEARW